MAFIKTYKPCEAYLGWLRIFSLTLSLSFFVFFFACSKPDNVIDEPTNGYQAEIQMLDSLAVVLSENFNSEKFENVVAQVRELTEADTLSPLYAYGLMYMGWFHANFQRYGPAETYFTRAYELAAEHQLWQLEIKMAPIAMLMFTNITREEKAEQLYQRLLELRLEHPFDLRQKYLFDISQAFWFYHQNRMAEALELLLGAVPYFERENDTFYISNIYNAIGLTLSQTGNTEEALKWFEKTLVRQYQQRDVQNIARTLNNLGNIYRLQNDHHRAIDSLRSAKAINLENGRHLSVIRNYYNIGMSYNLLEKWNEALDAFRQGTALSVEHGLTPGIVFNQYGIASSFYQMGAEPEETLEILYDLAEAMESSGIMANALTTYRMLHELEEGIGNYEAALKWYKRYHEQVLEVDVRERDLSIENVLIQNQLEREKAENVFLRETIELKRQAEYYFIIVLLTLLVLTAVAVGFLVYFRYSSRELESVNGQLLEQSRSIAEQNKQLENLAQERQRLINVIIHDLRNPLSVMESAEELMDPYDPDSCVEMKTILRLSSEKMRNIVNSLLTVFEAESSDIRSEMSEIAVDAIVRQVIEEYRPQAEKKNMQINSRLEAFTTLTHDMVFNNIISNLLTNAIKYANPDTVIEVDLSMTETNWVLKIRDSGQGFAQNEKDKVFSLFAKLSSQPTAGESSVGVGLYSVKISTERLGGRVELNWEYTQGAEFICTFPLTEISVPQAELFQKLS